MYIYRPTYLYIKQHTITGKLYFGKTIKDPEKYLGSGKHWLRHIAKHGKSVVNLWYELFEDKDELVRFALQFSKDLNIVESNQWLNLIPENGLGGSSQPLSKEVKDKISKANSIPKSEEHKLKLALAQTGKTYSDVSKAKMAKAKTGIKHKNVTCPHCGKIGSGGVMHRYHFDVCKLRVS